MRYFFAFLWKHNFFFLFLILEVIALSLMVNSRNYQGSIILNATNRITGSFNLASSNVSNYFALNRANEQLLNHNTKLLFLQNSTLSETDTIFRYKDSLYRYTGAKVISNSIGKRNNYIMLNKGKKHGIKLDMGVIGINGIVGTVVGISENYCSVMSILHKDSKISAIIKKDRQLVNIVWDKIDYQYGTLTDIPSHLQLYQSDTISTSGHSFIFPSDITIGTVETYYQNTGESLNRAKIKFSTDFNKLYYVYIVDNLKKIELLNLREESENE